VSRQALTNKRYTPIWHVGRFLWSVAGAIVLVASGVVLDRVFDCDVYVFYPGSLLINWAGPFATYTVLVKISMGLFNLVIWTVVIYGAAQANEAWRTRRARRAIC
jgi:hypothetical protein